VIYPEKRARENHGAEAIFSRVVKINLDEAVQQQDALGAQKSFFGLLIALQNFFGMLQCVFAAILFTQNVPLFQPMFHAIQPPAEAPMSSLTFRVTTVVSYPVCIKTIFRGSVLFCEQI
jgi:hypothetical protein